MEQDVLIAATLAAGLFPRAPNLDAQKAAQIYFDVLDALQTERRNQPGAAARRHTAKSLPDDSGKNVTPIA
jgi:hypothetical protein